MKALACYTVIFNIAVIVLILLGATGTINPPPFSWFESIVWIVLTIPVVIFGFIALRKPK